MRIDLGKTMACATAAAVGIGLLTVNSTLAAAATDPYLAYRGSSVSQTTLPAGSLSLTAVSEERVSSATVHVGGLLVGTSTTVRPDGAGASQIEIPVDLSGVAGQVDLTLDLVTTGGTVSVAQTAYVVAANGPAPATGQLSTSEPAVLTAMPAPPPPGAPTTVATTPTPIATSAPTTVATTPIPIATSAPPSTSAPTSTPVPTATQTAGPTAAAPLGAQRPNGSNTGVPDGTTLTRSGPLVISTPGVTISNLDIVGCVVVRASDVTLRNVRITCTAPSRNRVVLLEDGVRNFVIEDSEIDGTGTADIGIGWSNYTMRRVEVRGVCDGARVTRNVLIESSWIHDLQRMKSLHCDAVQTTGGGTITIRGNSLDPSSRAGDLNNAAVMIGTELGTRLLHDMSITGNWVGGGNYSINVRSDANLRNVVANGNVFVGGARYGPVIAPPSFGLSGNVLLNGEAWRVQPAR